MGDFSLTVSKWLLNLLFLFSSQVVSDLSQLHGLQHARLPCSSLSPRVCSDSCPLSWWCHPAILFSVTLSSPGLRSFPLSRSFPVSWLFTPGSWSIGTSASALLFPMNIQGWFSLGLTGLSPCWPRDSQESSPAPYFKSVNSLALSFLYGPILISQMTTGKTIALTIWTFVGKVMSQLFNTLSRFVILFCPRRKHLSVSWLWSLFPVILEPKKMKSDTVSTFSPSICHEVIGPDAMIFVFVNTEL